MKKPLTADRSGRILKNLLGEFDKRFLNGEVCREWLLDAIYPEGVFCPKCETELAGKRLNSFYRGKRAQCPACGQQWSVWKDTPLHGTHFSPGKIILVGFLAGLGIPISHIARRVRCSPASVKLTIKRINQLEARVRAPDFKASENIRPGGGHRPETADDTDTAVQPFKTIKEILTYLRTRGWKISESGLYKHFQCGKLRKEDGVFQRERVDRYAATYLTAERKDYETHTRTVRQNFQSR